MGTATKPYYPNILTISGTGRNVGKTTLTCSIIKKMSTDQKSTAIKISPHFHRVDYKYPVFEESEAYSMYREDSKDRGKDSSKMLAAGADRVFYIQTRDNFLGDLWRKLSQHISEDMPVIIESGAIEKVIEPGLSILVTKTGAKKFNEAGMAENVESTDKTKGEGIAEKVGGARRASRRLVIHIEDFNHIIDRISFKEGNWEIRKKHDRI